MNKMKFSGSAVFGIILIAVGVVSLFSSLNYFDSWDIFSTFWPMIIVLFGVKSLIDHRSSTLFGIVLIAVGTFLQLDELGLWYLGDIYVRELIVPSIIILIGLYFVLPKGNKEEDRGPRQAEKVTPAPNPEPVKPVQQEEVKKTRPEPIVKTSEVRADQQKTEVSNEQKDATIEKAAEIVEDKDIVIE